MNTHRPLLSPLRRFLEIIPEAWPISPAQCEREKVKAYARAHASPLCGFEVPAASLPLPPAVQARVEMGRWHGAHSRHPFGAN